MDFTLEELLPYRIGGLLYLPATKQDIVFKLENRSIQNLTSIALCLEDSIQSTALDIAEKRLKETLCSIQAKGISSLPLLFVRVCTPKHLKHVHEFLGESENILTGYILPKFDLNNCDEYIEFFREVNKDSEKKLCFMPILESRQIADAYTRMHTLGELKQRIDDVKDLVLNVRVGGNDFCNLFGLRRSVKQNIYQIGTVRDILVDILNVFSGDYVVSGPVWEYFDDKKSNDWLVGLKNELELDGINGFIGKTVIHPTQLPAVWEHLQVSKNDYRDAVNLLDWKQDVLGVEKGAGGGRMNEKKCHENWARKILRLAAVYGVKDE